MKKKNPKKNDDKKNLISQKPKIIDNKLNENESDKNLDLELYTGDDIEIDKKIEDVLIKKGEMATCKIITKNNNGTGFFCKIPLYNQLIKFLFTSNHLINKDLIKTGNNIHFVYKLKRKKIKITDNRKCFTNEDLDYTCIEIFDEDEIEDFFDVENKEYKDINEHFLNEDIAIIQYPKGGPLKINAGHLKEINENMIKHTVSTDYGSSGAPIILYERNYEILGIHRGRNTKLNINMGIYIKFVIEDIKILELALIDSEIKHQNEKIKQLNEEIKKRNNIEEYFDIIKEYIELDLRFKTIKEKVNQIESQAEEIEELEIQKLRLKNKLDSLIYDINKEDEDKNKLKKKINDLKDNKEMFIKIILEYIELKEKKEKYFLLENLNIQIEEFKTKKIDLEKEYELEESCCDLENFKVENINELLQTFNERNEDINIDIENYYDRIKTYVEIDEEVKNLNNILFMLRRR